jgi:hypothetical protein
MGEPKTFNQCSGRIQTGTSRARSSVSEIRITEKEIIEASEFTWRKMKEKTDVDPLELKVISFVG